MSRLLVVIALLLVGGCRCKSESDAKAPVVDEELKALIAQRPKDGCSTFQVVDGPDGKKRLECVQLLPADAGR